MASFTFILFGFMVLFTSDFSSKLSFVLCETAKRLSNDAKFPYLSPVIEFYPKELKSVIENQERQVSFGVAWENTTGSALNSSINSGKYFGSEFKVNIRSENPDILQIVNSSHLFCISSKADVNNFTFTVKGMFLGYTKVTVSLLAAHGGCLNMENQIHELGQDSTIEESQPHQNFEVPASVIRVPSALVPVVTGIMSALVAFNYVNMGVQLDLSTIGKVLKRPIGPSIGFVCQFLFMPLASFGFSMLLFDDISLRLGLFVLGCSPGGSMSNFWTLLFNGDVNLSVTMTFISTIGALAMMPLWIFTLGASFFRDRAATIPYLNLAGSLILLTIPIGFGLLIQQYSPRLAKFSRKIIKPVTIVCALFGIFVGLYANSFVFKLFTWQVVLAGMCVGWSGYCFGALMAWIFRLEKSQIIAVSIETAFQNPAVAFVMLLISLPQPEADITSVPVICQLMITGLPMWFLLVITKIRTKCNKNRKEVEDVKEKPDLDDLTKEYMAVETDPSKEVMNNNDHFALHNNPQKVQIVRFTN